MEFKALEIDFEQNEAIIGLLSQTNESLWELTLSINGNSQSGLGVFDPFALFMVRVVAKMLTCDSQPRKFFKGQPSFTKFKSFYTFDLSSKVFGV